MQCKRINCDNTVTGKALFCSGACRTAVSRADTAMQVLQATVTDVTLEPTVTPPEQAQRFPTYDDDRAKYATRTNPDKLNHGQHMNSSELEQAGLKANRVPIPGDRDYAGVCVKTEAGWAVA